MSALMMRIMGGKTITEMPMAIFLPHADQAESNHYQSLTRLNERGGLDPREALAVLTDKPWYDMKDITQQEAELRLRDMVQGYLDTK